MGISHFYLSFPQDFQKYGLSRQHAAETMEKAGVLPGGIRAELPFDSYSLELATPDQTKKAKGKEKAQAETL